MRYHRHNRSTEPRTITVKFSGKCACCGAVIPTGATATYYPDRKAIAHMGGLEGNSGTCTANIREQNYGPRDPGEDAADRWNETYGDRW